MSNNLLKVMERIQELTVKAAEMGETAQDMLTSATEELGEVAACISHEKGRKEKDLSEDSVTESIDLAICALSIMFMKGGTIEDIAKIGLDKLEKWNSNLDKRKEISKQTNLNNPSEKIYNWYIEVSERYGGREIGDYDTYEKIWRCLNETWSKMGMNQSIDWSYEPLQFARQLNELGKKGPFFHIRIIDKNTGECLVK